MADYLHLFGSVTDFTESYNGNDYQEPWISYTEETKKVNYNKSEREKLLETPLTFIIQSDGNIRWATTHTGVTRTVEYSKNGGEWISIRSATGDTAPSISVVSGDTIQFRGNNERYSTSSSYYNCFSGSTCSFSAKGNIMSLINSTNFANLTTLASTYTFFNMFYNCTGLTDASNLLLPATTLALLCYSGMFENCTGLVSGPSSIGTSATILANSCCQHMFRGCTSLVQAPALPATELEEYCYDNMFRDCTDLITAPALPATTLFDYCYRSMFYNCTSLVKAPALPATTLAVGCYIYMFRNCSSLNYIKCLATNISAGSCTSNWVSGVASTGTFVTPSSTNWSTDVSGVPSGWSRVDAS